MAIMEQADGMRTLRAMGLPMMVVFLIVFWAMVITLLMRLA